MEKNKKIYQDVWAMMDACNSSGVIHSLSNKIVPYVWEEFRGGLWTEEFNHHPLILITLDKLMQLGGCYLSDSSDHNKISKAYQYVLDNM